ncbi:MAG: hypothetical protein AB7V50_03190 [Vampirovibrionia bacterium]
MSFKNLVITLLIFLGCQSCFVLADYYTAQDGVLDLGHCDEPLNYIDRQPYSVDPPAVQQERFNATNEYLKAIKAQQESFKQQALSEIDAVSQSYNQAKKNYDNSRKSYNNNYNYYYSPYDQTNFSTELKKHPNLYNNYEYYNSYGHHGYQPYMGVFNMPGYMGNVEAYYDGLDNDNDNFIDEGFAHGNVQIVIGDSGINKDDEWALYVDNSSMGFNDHGMVRTWDLNLFSGTHKITIVAANIPDGMGTYSVSFRNAYVVSGPPLVGGNIPQGQSLQWIIKVK